MKELKAYIRQVKAEEVIHALEEAGVPGLTAIEVKCMGPDVDPEKTIFSLDYAERFYPFTKIEVVCMDEDVIRLVDVIRENAYTGHRGDGMIFVSDIEQAVKIRTGEWGEGALRPTDEEEG